MILGTLKIEATKGYYLEQYTLEGDLVYLEIKRFTWRGEPFQGGRFDQKKVITGWTPEAIKKYMLTTTIKRADPF